MNASIDASASIDFTELAATVRFPEVPLSAAERSDLIDQAYEEYCERVEGGEDLDPDAYCGRFPAFQTSLRRLVQAHRHLQENPGLLRELSVRWPEPGDSFLGFRMLSELGRGAFARVYLAQEMAVGGRLVAVKLSLHDDHEADTLGRLQHPNVVPIYSTHHDPGTGFTVVVMPFLGGTTLCHVIDYAAAATARPKRSTILLDAARDARWPGENAPQPAATLTRGSYVDGALHVAERLASALAYVHDEGIVHRDLKPSNVLLCPNGVPLLLDFNLALDRVVHDYRLGGTLPYMPPEQLEAIDHRRAYRGACADVRSDLYGLGVIIFELLGRAHPYGPVPSKLSTLQARDWLLDRLRKGPRPLRELNPDVDRRLADFAGRCIACDPKDRPATAREMAHELRWFQSLGRRARRWAIANWKSVTAAGVLALVPAGAAAHYLATMPPLTARQSQAGDEFLRAGKLHAAVAAYSKSLDLDRNQPEALFGRGRAYMLLGEHSKALQDLMDSDPEARDGRALACRAYCEAALGKPHLSIELCNLAKRAGFMNGQLLNNRAVCQLDISNWQEALLSTESALTKLVDCPQTLMIRAMARFQLGQLPTGSNDQFALAYQDASRAVSLGLHTRTAYYKAAVLAQEYVNRFGQEADPAASASVQQWARKAIEYGYPREQLENCPKIGAIVKALPPDVVAIHPVDAAADLLLMDPLETPSPRK